MGQKPVKMKMILNEDILNELRAISPVLAKVPYMNVFTVDPQYFSGIQPELRARISADEFYTSREVFTVPEGYFEGLSANILEKIKARENNAVAEELSELSPFIVRISKENIYRVPEGYFEQLEFIPGLKLPAKVIQMNPVRSRSIFRYAAAAVITGLLGISIINIVDKTNTLGENPGTRIQIATKEVLTTANNIIQTGTFDKELNDLSDKEIEQYLQQSGRDVNAALVASSLNDNSKLPEATDYLLDENTLDNYLKDNNLKN